MSGDFSVLAPMSVKDLIWVQVAQSLKVKYDHEQELARSKAYSQTAEAIYMAIIDAQEIARDTNWYAKIGALKESPKAMRKIAPLNRKDLPSSILEAQRKEEARRAAMTEEERREDDVKRFMEGKRYTP